MDKTRHLHGTDSGGGEVRGHEKGPMQSFTNCNDTGPKGSEGSGHAGPMLDPGTEKKAFLGKREKSR